MESGIIYWDETVKKIMNTEKIAIYGAGVMGKALQTCLINEPYCKTIDSFIVNDITNNPSSIDGIPVTDIEQAEDLKEHMILVALHEKHINEAVAELERKGFKYIIPISFDSDVWSSIRGNWFNLYQADENGSYERLEEALNPGLHVYVVHSIYDRKLKETPICRDYEIPIQVGASLTDEQICTLRDNIGDNISALNRKFCEITALYWIWKHDNAMYAGLCHYRRKFKIGEWQARTLTTSGIDLIVTVPVLNFNGVGKQYGLDHDANDWKIMMKVLGELHPEYIPAAVQVEKGIYYYAYNMFIARHEILDKYCSWLFPVLFRCEEIIGEKEDAYQNRYAGFLAERLLTVYLVHNKQYRVVVADKHFIEVDEESK